VVRTPQPVQDEESELHADEGFRILMVSECVTCTEFKVLIVSCTVTVTTGSDNMSHYLFSLGGVDIGGMPTGAHIWCTILGLHLSLWHCECSWSVWISDNLNIW
jgi:hypothetical protein